MDFRTELDVKPSTFQIGLKDPILTLGSCFAETMGRKLLENKFQVLANPFGTSYHPLAIHKLINYSVFQEYPQPHTYILNQERHLNYDFHSRFHGSSLGDIQENINTAIASVHYFLKTCKTIIITYGTAWVYELEDTGVAVANCHKMPAKLFAKRLSKPEELIDSFNSTRNSLRTLNPNVKILLTVSPVRHVKDTLTLNSASKAVLRLVCNELTNIDDGIEYFPAYEIMLDDLRDYRYYKDDLIHPTPLAEEYIWEKFGATYFSRDTLDFINRYNRIRKSLLHRPFDIESSSHKKFLRDLLAELERLQNTADVGEEIEGVRAQLANKAH